MQLYSTSDELLYNLEATTSSEAKRIWKANIKDHWEHKTKGFELFSDCYYRIKKSKRTKKII